LHQLILKKNSRFNFNKVRIGDGLAWGVREEERMKKEIIKIFISYSHSNQKCVEEIVDIAEEHLNIKSTLHDIWLDKWKMKGGKWFQDQMLSGLQESDFLIMMVSKNSIDSNAVSIEWKTKFAEKITNGQDTVFPFIIDDTSHDAIPTYLKNIFTYRYNNDKEKVIKLMDDIEFWKTEQIKSSIAK
jgi:hypothetical protein